MSREWGVTTHRQLGQLPLPLGDLLLVQGVHRGLDLLLPLCPGLLQPGGELSELLSLSCFLVYSGQRRGENENIFFMDINSGLTTITASFSHITIKFLENYFFCIFVRLNNFSFSLVKSFTFCPTYKVHC